MRFRYRQQAMKWHPDKNPNNYHEAQERFLEVAEAYDVLSDKEKKAIYDVHGYMGLKQGLPDDAGEMREGYHFDAQDAQATFKQFFGSDNPFVDFGFGEAMPFASILKKNGPSACPDLEVKLHCTLEQIFKGATLSVAVERHRIQNEVLGTETKTFSIKALSAWQDGDKVTYKGEGNEDVQRVAGNLVFVISIKEHEYYSRSGNDLIYRSKIKLMDALGDCVIEVPTLDGRKLAIACNEVISPTTEKVIPQEGFQGKDKVQGNIRIQFDIKFPTHLTALQKKSLVKILA